MKEQFGSRVLASVIGGILLGGALMQAVAVFMGAVAPNENFLLYGSVGGLGLGLLLAAKWLPSR